MNDPFKLSETYIAPRGTGKEIDWSKMLPGEVALCKLIGERVHKILTDVANRSLVPLWIPTGLWAGADIACSHMQRELDLDRLLHADDLSLTAFYIAIAGSINRINGAIANNDAPPIARFQKMR